MGEWFVRPDTRRLPLSEEQWIVVRSRLSAGEHRAHLERSSYIDRADNTRRIDSLKHGLSTVVAYLLDWSLENPIRGVSEQDLIVALDSLDPARFAEIHAAIMTHEAAMLAARAEKKTIPTIEPPSAPILSSPCEPGSPSSKSDTLM